MDSLFLLIPFLLPLLIFLIVMKVEPRSLWSGFLFFCTVGGLGISALLLLMRWSAEWQDPPELLRLLLIGLMFAALIVLLTFPFLLAAIFMIEGVRLIRSEGFSLSNCLSIGFSLLILADIFLLPYIGSILNSAVLSWLYGILTFIIGYLSVVLAMFAFSALLNLIHIRKTPYDQIVVLGSGIFETRVPPLLAARIEKGIELQKKNPGSWLILSGGQGPGEAIPEGAAMKAYAIEHGADASHVLSEEKSANTRENLAFSKVLFPVPNGKTAVVTTRYHVFRALLYAKEQNIACKGYGSKTKWYFTLNAFLREFVAYLSLTRKKQIRNILLVLSPFWLMLILELITDIALRIFH